MGKINYLIVLLLLFSCTYRLSDVLGLYNKNIRKEVLSKNLSFWLHWSNSTIIKRISNNKKRPLAFRASKIKNAKKS